MAPAFPGSTEKPANLPEPTWLSGKLAPLRAAYPILNSGFLFLRAWIALKRVRLFVLKRFIMIAGNTTSWPVRMPKSLPAYLSGIARDIAEVVGMNALQRLADAFGGTEVRISSRNPGLREALTPNQLKAFCHHFQNEKIYIPKLRFATRHSNQQRAVELESQGKTRAQIARILGVSERAIYSYLREARANRDGKR